MASQDVDETIAELFHEHARPLVRLARLFADDRNAAEDLVQEAFLRLRRALGRIKQREVIEALRDLPLRQRDCLVLRYYLELGTGDIADTLSTNSVKTHTRRGWLEERLRNALFATALQVEASPDLFARIQGSIEDDTRRRAWRRKTASIGAAGITVFLGLLFTVSEHGEGGVEMSWWIFEIAVTIILVALVILLGPFIKRFGKSYAAEVFRSNPGTGKSFIVLMDIAY